MGGCKDLRKRMLTNGSPRVHRTCDACRRGVRKHREGCQQKQGASVPERTKTAERAASLDLSGRQSVFLREYWLAT